MNLKPLLEYQENEIALKRLKRELSKHPEQIALDKTKAEFKLAQKTVADNDEAAGYIVRFYQKTLSGYQEYLEKIDGLVEKLDATDESDETARKAVAQEIDAMRSRLLSIEKKLAESKTASDKIIQSSTDARKRQKKLKDDGARLTALVEELKKTQEGKIAELNARMAAARKEVEPKMMERYDRLAADNKYPPINEVKIIDKSYYCFCGIDLPSAIREELLDKKLCVCGNCGRIVFIQ